MVPWRLGTLYSHLDERVRNAVRSVDRYDVISYADANFLQLFLWETFEALSPIPKVFQSIQPERVDGVDKIKNVPPEVPWAKMV